MPKLTTLSIVLLLMAALGFVSSLFILIPMIQTGIFAQTAVMRFGYWVLGSCALVIIAARDIKKHQDNDPKI